LKAVETIDPDWDEKAAGMLTEAAKTSLQQNSTGQT
jgi:hypothetical protein